MRKSIPLAFCAGLLMAAIALAADIRSRTFTPDEIEAMKAVRATIETPLGAMEIRFFPESAPNHVDNFIALARSGFYDGTLFHRVIPGFMIQGGDPNSKNPNRTLHGSGGPGYSLKAEFNMLRHKRGAVSMARSGHPDSAGSQFFICVTDAPHLDGQYTVFGEVVSGMEAADRIVALKADVRSNPVEPAPMAITLSGGAPAPEGKEGKH